MGQAVRKAEYKKKMEIESVVSINRKRIERNNRGMKFEDKVKIGILSIFTLLMIFSIIFRYSAINSQIDKLYALESQIKATQSERDSLYMTLEPYKSTERIESLAKIRLGMDYVKNQELVKLNVDYKLAENKDKKENLEASFFSTIMSYFNGN